MASDCARVYERLESARATGFLDLSECKLTQIPNGVLMVMKSSYDPEVDLSITRCSLAKNLLKNFPPKLVREEKLFGNLSALDISSNKLSVLPSEIEGMKVLKELDLSRNQFEYVPEIVWSLPGIEFVGLAGNVITTVSVERIRDAPNLKRIDLSENPINDVVKSELKAFAIEKGVTFDF